MPFASLQITNVVVQNAVRAFLRTRSHGPPWECFLENPILNWPPGSMRSHAAAWEREEQRHSCIQPLPDVVLTPHSCQAGVACKKGHGPLRKGIHFLVRPCFKMKEKTSLTPAIRRFWITSGSPTAALIPFAATSHLNNLLDRS